MIARGTLMEFRRAFFQVLHPRYAVKHIPRQRPFNAHVPILSTNLVARIWLGLQLAQLVVVQVLLTIDAVPGNELASTKLKGVNTEGVKTNPDH